MKLQYLVNLIHSWEFMWKGEIKCNSADSTIVLQHHSAPEDLLPPLTCPLPDEPRPRGRSFTAAASPSRPTGQHPGGVGQRRGRLRLQTPTRPWSSLQPAAAWNTNRLLPKTAGSLLWLLCWDHSVNTTYTQTWRLHVLV